MSRFDDVFSRVIGEEGGYVDDLQDPGGETKFGISKRSYPLVDIKNLTLDDAKAIYLRDYWAKIQGDYLGQPLDEFLFDYAVNSGVLRASDALQAALGVYQDGKIGHLTLEALQGREPEPLIRSIFIDRAMTFAHSHILDHAGRGWFGRLFDKTALALKGLP